MSSRLERGWYTDSLLARSLIPLSWLFAGLSRWRRWRLQRAAQRHRLPVPVIVVGNISVGGTGKTPLLITLVELLREAGYRPGVISRGYGGTSDHYPLLVTPETAPQRGGDEPVLIASQCRCPVVVDPNRLQAARYLLAQSDCNVILSDDGLQHYRLPRDIELAVIDGARGFGNGRRLPAGPLREPVERLREVDSVLVNGGNPEQFTGGVAMQVIAKPMLRALGNQPDVALRDWPFTRRQVHAVAGIGNPQRFADTLNSHGFEVELHAFPDHHPYRAEDIQFEGNRAVIMTAKDAVKCSAFSGPDHWVLDVMAKLPAGWCQQLVEKVNNISGRSL